MASPAKPRDIRQLPVRVPTTLDSLRVRGARDQVVVSQREVLALANLACVGTRLGSLRGQGRGGGVEVWGQDGRQEGREVGGRGQEVVGCQRVGYGGWEDVRELFRDRGRGVFVQEGWVILDCGVGYCAQFRGEGEECFASQVLEDVVRWSSAGGVLDHGRSRVMLRTSVKSLRSAASVSPSSPPLGTLATGLISFLRPLTRFFGFEDAGASFSITTVDRQSRNIS